MDPNLENYPVVVRVQGLQSGSLLCLFAVSLSLRLLLFRGTWVFEGIGVQKSGVCGLNTGTWAWFWGFRV